MPDPIAQRHMPASPEVEGHLSMQKVRHMRNYASAAFRGSQIKFDHPFTFHGFRSSFRDWAGNVSSFPPETTETALAHIIGD
jgi:integrase